MDSTNWLVQFFSFLKPSIQIIQKSPSYFSVPPRIFCVLAIQYDCFKSLDSFKGIPLSHSHPQNGHPHTELLFPVPLVFPPHRAIAIQPHQEDIFFAKGATHVQCIKCLTLSQTVISAKVARGQVGLPAFYEETWAYSVLLNFSISILWDENILP